MYDSPERARNIRVSFYYVNVAFSVVVHLALVVGDGSSNGVTSNEGA